MNIFNNCDDDWNADYKFTPVHNRFRLVEVVCSYIDLKQLTQLRNEKPKKRICKSSEIHLSLYN